MPINLINTVAIADSNITQDKLASGVPSATNITTGTLPRARLPSGSVLQVVSASTTTRITTTSTSYVDTGLSVSITPSSASSKILIISVFSVGNSSSNFATFVNIVRNSTQIAQRTSYPGSSSNSEYMAVTGGLTVLDEPATTSLTTYKIQYRADNGTSTFSGPSNQGYGTGTATNHSSIVIMEIAA